MFSCNKGIRQGDGLSPVLFSMIYRNTLGTTMSRSHAWKPFYKLPHVSDDLLVLSPSPEGLQKSINVIKKHALKVNTKKSNIIIFTNQKQ